MCSRAIPTLGGFNGTAFERRLLLARFEFTYCSQVRPELHSLLPCERCRPAAACLLLRTENAEFEITGGTLLRPLAAPLLRPLISDGRVCCSVRRRRIGGQ